MSKWFFFSLLSFFLIGVQRFFYKIVATKKIDPDVTTFYFMTGVAFISSAWFFAKPQELKNLYLLMLLSFGNSMSFLLATLSHIRSLKYIKASIAFPLIRLNILLVVSFSILILKENIMFSQYIGIFLALICMILLTLEQTRSKNNSPKDQNPYKGLIFVLIAMICGATSSITSKIAAEKVNFIPFITFSYIMASLVLLFINYKKIKEQTKKDVLKLGFSMSLLNFFGFFFYLKALKIGPLSVISSINGLHFMVAVALSVVIYKEKLSNKNVISLILAVVSIILLKGIF